MAGGEPRLLWDALRSREIDVVPEYTGTIAEKTLRAPGPSENGGEREAWLGAELGAHRISDLARVPGVRLGFSNEFMSRQDGWPRLRERYGLEEVRVTGLDHDLAYRALEQGEIDAAHMRALNAREARAHPRTSRLSLAGREGPSAR